jgi:hypothetical protein
MMHTHQQKGVKKPDNEVKKTGFLLILPCPGTIGLGPV